MIHSKFNEVYFELYKNIGHIPAIKPVKLNKTTATTSKIFEIESESSTYTSRAKTRKAQTQMAIETFNNNEMV
jgi:hypothetical protein